MNAQALGWDIHRKFSKVSLEQMTAEGEIQVVERARLEHDDREAMRRWLSRVPQGTPVAVEAAYGWPWIADLLEEMGLEPHLGHPPAIKVLSKTEAKGDRIDADRLGKFQLRGILPEAYLATPDVRMRRERVRYRMALSGLRTAVKNRIQAILHRLGILHAFSDLFGKAGRRFLDGLDLPEASREVLAGYLELLDRVSASIKQVEGWMAANLQVDETIQLLMTIPGIGLILAHVISAEIGEIERFPSRRHLNSYAGLAPLSDDSADRHGQRHCSPACNHALRWALIEAVTGVLNSRGPRGLRLRKLYARLTRGGCCNKSQAKVAVARELAQRVYVVWSQRTPYSDNPPSRPGTNEDRAGVDGHPRTQADMKQTKPMNTIHAYTQHMNMIPPHTKQAMRSDEPRHPMVRCRSKTVRQTRS
jgi:transposase